MNNYLKENHNEFKEIMKECENLRWRKLNDYGLTYNEYGYVGLLVKLGDKYGRIKRLYEKSLDGKKPNFETSRDSLIDLVNYAVMALMEVNKNDKN
jgi:hypothetical protein